MKIYSKVSLSIVGLLFVGLVLGGYLFKLYSYEESLQKKYQGLLNLSRIITIEEMNISSHINTFLLTNKFEYDKMVQSFVKIQMSIDDITLIMEEGSESKTYEKNNYLGLRSQLYESFNIQKHEIRNLHVNNLTNKTTNEKFKKSIFIFNDHKLQPILNEIIIFYSENFHEVEKKNKQNILILGIFAWIMMILVIGMIFKINQFNILLDKKVKNRTNKLRKEKEKVVQLMNQNSVLLNHTPEGIVGLNSKGNITFINPSAKQMLCVDGDLDNYTHISEIIKINKNKKSLSSFFGENCNDAVGSGKTSKYSNVSFVVSSNNKSLDVDLEITSLKNSNKNLEGYILNFRNISERLKLEQELNHERAMSAHSAKLASLGEMAGGIAHEINTPLAVIMLSNEEIGAELTSDKPDYNYVLSLVATIKDTTEKVSKIVKALRALSHVGGDNTQESILIDSIIDNVLTLSNEKIRINQVSLTYENQIGSDSVIYCDQVQMSQVLLNLISNSIDAIETLDDRWIKVQVSECNDFIQISIIDSGRGIHDSSLDKIFEPFYTTKSVGKGTGLGMSISKAIMTKHGGKIAYDKRSSNTKFDLFLPKININQKVS